MFGASYSVKAVKDFGYNDHRILIAGLKDLGIRRLRLMSYWDEIELKPREYSFKDLDMQIALAKKYNAEVTLCLGVRQPRWPEMHIPKWALNLAKNDWEDQLCLFIEKVVKRYKNNSIIISWQLENEALNRGFGTNGEFSRERLRREFELVKSLDSTRPIIMSTSNSWGIPLRAPLPDIVGFSLYKVIHQKNGYSHDRRPAIFYKLRANSSKILRRRPAFIHELQLEPWGPRGNSEMRHKQQLESMSLEQFRNNVVFAKKTNLYPIDVWGLEWWYWMLDKHNDSDFWNEAKNLFKD